MRFLFTFILTIFLLAPAITLADAKTGTCISSPKTSAEVGVFLQGICGECWDQGNCSLNDFMTGVANAGNYILSIVGALAFLMYVIGGFYWLISRGNDKMVSTGKDYIKYATIGLVIVLIAYTGVVALRTTITKGTLSEGYVICAGNGDVATEVTDTDGQICGPNAVCKGYSCISNCEDHGGSCVAPDMVTIMNTPTVTVSCTAITNGCPDAIQQCCLPIVTTPPTP